MERRWIAVITAVFLGTGLPLVSAEDAPSSQGPNYAEATAAGHDAAVGQLKPVDAQVPDDDGDVAANELIRQVDQEMIGHLQQGQDGMLEMPEAGTLIPALGVMKQAEMDPEMMKLKYLVDTGEITKDQAMNRADELGLAPDQEQQFEGLLNSKLKLPESALTEKPSQEPSEPMITNGSDTSVGQTYSEPPQDHH